MSSEITISNGTTDKDATDTTALGAYIFLAVLALIHMACWLAGCVKAIHDRRRIKNRPAEAAATKLRLLSSNKETASKPISPKFVISVNNKAPFEETKPATPQSPVYHHFSRSASQRSRAVRLSSSALATKLDEIDELKHMIAAPDNETRLHQANALMAELHPYTGTYDDPPTERDWHPSSVSDHTVPSATLYDD